MKSRNLLKITTSSATVLALVFTAATSFAGSTMSMDGNLAAPAAAPPANTAGFKFQIGLTYVDLNDLSDSIEKRNPYYSVDQTWPVGISFSPSYEFTNGLALGLEIGPAVWGTGDADFYIIPVGLDVRYTFMRDKAVSPYVRAGMQYAFAGGDFVDSSSVGFYAKAGLEFGHSKRIGWGIELGYSSTGVDVLAGNDYSTETVRPYEFTGGVFIRF